MYLDISYGWQQRMDTQTLRKRRRRNRLVLVIFLGLVMIGGALAAWHLM